MNHDNSSKNVLSINKSQLAQLPAAQFHGDIRVIENEDGIADAIADLRKSDVIGFDTETRPSFRKGQTNSVALIQMSTRSVCYLFRINQTGLEKAIIDLMEDGSILKIGLSIHDDFHNLNRIAHINPKGFIDLQHYVKDFRIADNSLTRIYGIVFGHRVSKGQRLTNWEAEQLSPSQQSYAALDAMACVEIYDHLSKGLFNPDESPYILSPEQEREEGQEQPAPGHTVPSQEECGEKTLPEE